MPTALHKIMGAIPKDNRYRPGANKENLQQSPPTVHHVRPPLIPAQQVPTQSVPISVKHMIAAADPDNQLVQQLETYVLLMNTCIAHRPSLLTTPVELRSPSFTDQLSHYNSMIKEHAGQIQRLSSKVAQGTKI